MKYDVIFKNGTKKTVTESELYKLDMSTVAFYTYRKTNY